MAMFKNNCALMAPFLFLLAKAARASLPTAAHFVAPRPPLTFRLAQFVPFCQLFTDLGCTNKSTNSLLTLGLSVCSRCTVLSSIFPCTTNSSTSGRNCLISSPLISGYIESPDTHFCGAATRLMSWPGRMRYFCLLRFLGGFSHLTSRIHSSLF